MNDDKPVEDVKPEEFDLNSLADSLLNKDEGKNEEAEGVKTEDEKVTEDEKSIEGEKPNGDKPVDDTSSTTNDKTESETSAEDNKTLTREEIKAALREEAQEREALSSQRISFAGKVREDLKEALALDSTYTKVALEDGTPITSVSQLTQVINPDTEEPYTREEAAQLLLEAQQIVNENIKFYEQRVDELTDLNVNFKEEADRVDELYGDILKALPDVAKELLEAYQKTFKLSDDGSYVESVPVSPLEFYGPALKPFRTAVDQMHQQEAEAKVAETRAIKEAEIKAEQADRGDIGATAGAAQGKPDLLDDALNNYLNR